jgi:hypothetical protein
MLGPLGQELIEAACPAPGKEIVREFLSNHCAASLPGVGDSAEWMELVDRVQLAALRGSGWDMARIRANVALANVDWRDLLVAAGFGQSLSAHIAWQRAALQSHDVS